MADDDDIEAGLGDAIESLRHRFLHDVEKLRAQLHRFCTRMTGSVLDGEDIVQETLVHAFYRLPTLKDYNAMTGWLYRIAHNKCIDFHRARKPDISADLVGTEPEHLDVDRPEERQEVRQALETLVGILPPKERAAVLLKDVFDYSLLEIAEIVDSTIGGVKAALHRGRQKLRTIRKAGRTESRTTNNIDVLQAYLDSFNAQDWDRVRSLIREDARLEIVGRGESRLGKGYFTNYAAWPWPWHLTFGTVDGEPTVIHYRFDRGQWQPHSVLRIRCTDGAVDLVRDYVHIDYLLDNAKVRRTGDLPDR